MNKDFFKNRKDIFKDNIIKLTGETKQNKIAEKLHVSETKISHWFTGTTPPSLDDLLYISQEYDCSIDMLIGNEHTASNDFSVYDICKILTDIDMEIGFMHEKIETMRIYDEEIDYFEIPDTDGKIKTDYCSIYFPDRLEGPFPTYSYDGKKINNFLKKYEGLKQARKQQLIDNDIFKDAVNAQLRKLSKEKITFKEREPNFCTLPDGIDE